MGVKVLEFGFGYPPRLLGKKIGETIYSVNFLPFGGFVKLFGQQREELSGEELKDPRAFINQGKKKRAIVIVAGVIGNFLLGALCFSLVYSLIGIPEKADYVTVSYVMPGSPAEEAGIRIGDRIVRVLDSPADEEGVKIDDTDDFGQVVQEKKGEQIKIEVISKAGKAFDEGTRREVSVTPRLNPPEEEGPLGVIISDYDNIFYPSWQMPVRGAWVGIQEAIAWGVAMVFGLVQIIKELFVGVVPQVAGPVKIYKMTAEFAAQGLIDLTRFIGIFSINLAVINLLPFPALDGGWLALVFLEKARGRKLRSKVEYWLNAAGMALVIGLMLAISAREIIEELKNAGWWAKLPF